MKVDYDNRYRSSLVLRDPIPIDTGYYACRYQKNNVSKTIHNPHEIDQIYVYVKGILVSICRLLQLQNAYAFCLSGGKAKRSKYRAVQSAYKIRSTSESYKIWIK